MITLNSNIGWRALLPIATSFAIYGATFQIYLHHFSTQFSADFARQNAAQLSSGNIYEISNRVNSVLGSSNWTCVIVQKGGEEFYRRQRGPCGNGLLYREEIITGSGNSGIQVRFTQRLPNALEYLLLFLGMLMGAPIAIATVLFRRLEIERIRSAELLAGIASQVAHDIRAPVLTLSTLINNTDGVDDPTRSDIEAVAKRIRDIANNLLARYTRASSSSSIQPAPGRSVLPAVTTLLSDEPKSTEYIPSSIETIVQEMRAQNVLSSMNQDICVEISPFLAFAEIQSTELSRVFSNLINNGIEAIRSKGPLGWVKISLHQTVKNQVQLLRLVISDNGAGIPKELVTKVLEPGGTFGKLNGHGFGLSHAKRTIESNLGSLNIKSTEGTGTDVIIELPQALAPKCCAKFIAVSSRTKIIVLITASTLCEFWETRFAHIRSKYPDFPAITYLRSNEELRAYYRNHLGDPESNFYYILDLETREAVHAGIDLIEMLGIGEKSIIVTSQFGDSKIRLRAEKWHFQLLPRNLVSWIPIEVDSSLAL